MEVGITTVEALSGPNVENGLSAFPNRARFELEAGAGDATLSEGCTDPSGYVTFDAVMAHNSVTQFVASYEVPRDFGFWILHMEIPIDLDAVGLSLMPSASGYGTTEYYAGDAALCG